MGDQPNSAGVTTVDQDSVWCGGGLHAGGDVKIGSATGEVALWMHDGNVQVDGNIIVGDALSQFKPVNLTIERFSVYLTVSGTGVEVDFVREADALKGSTIVIQNSTLQGNVTDPDKFPLGLHLLSGTPGNRRHVVRVSNTTFRNLGNYWTQNQAALDTYVSGSKGSETSAEVWSKFAAGSRFTRLNFTNPTGMSGHPPADSPWAVSIGDSLPITHSEFYGGFVGTGFTDYVWDNTFHSVCRDTYNPEAGALIQNNTYRAAAQGGGCKDIDFFRPDGRLRNNTLYETGVNLADGFATNNIAENNTIFGVGISCNLREKRVSLLNNTFHGGGTDGLLWLRCNNVTVINNQISEANRASLFIMRHPIDDGGEAYQNAWIERNTLLACGRAPDVLRTCFRFMDYNNSHVLALDIQGRGSSTFATYLLRVTNTTIRDTRISDASEGFRVFSSSNLVIENTAFVSINTLEYLFDASDSITIRNQNIASYPVRVLSQTSPTEITWDWSGLSPSTQYVLRRTASGATEDFAFITDPNGAGQITVSNPVAVTYTYSRLPPAPPMITDLRVVSVGPNYAVLSWTAPPDASQYDMRYSTGGPLTEANFEAGVAIPTMPPQAAGTTEVLNVTGLLAETRYWFALRSASENLEWSPVSNNVEVFIPDTLPPAAVNDLQAVAVGGDHVVLQWTAPGDDGNQGTAAVYDVRYSLTGPLDETSFGTATSVPAAAPGPAGTVESLNVTGLSGETQYWFALRTGDEVPNWSPLSNSAVAATLAIDVTPPTLAFVTPLEGSRVSGTVQVEVDATDDDGIREVRLFVDGDFLVSLTTGPYRWSWPTESVSPGPHVLTAVASDLSGNMATASLNLTVTSSAGGSLESRGPPWVRAVYYTPTDPQIAIVFSHGMNQSSVLAALSVRPALPFDLRWTGPSRLTLDFQEPPIPTVQYLVLIDSFAKDSKGNPLDSEFAFTFGGSSSQTSSLLLNPWVWASGLLALWWIVSLALYARSHRSSRRLDYELRRLDRAARSGSSQGWSPGRRRHR